MTQQLTRHTFSVTDFHRMAETGILRREDRVELIDGEIVQINPIGSRHFAVVVRLDRHFHASLAGRALVAVQGPLRLGGHDEPQPDLVLLRPRPGEYEDQLPTASDTLLVVEVADTSLAHDREVKAPLYASAGIPEYWLWDLPARRLLVHRDPTPNGYASIQTHTIGQTVHPLAFPDLSVAVDEIV